MRQRLKANERHAISIFTTWCGCAIWYFLSHSDVVKYFVDLSVALPAPEGTFQHFADHSESFFSARRNKNKKSLLRFPRQVADAFPSYDDRIYSNPIHWLLLRSHIAWKNLEQHRYFASMHLFKICSRRFCIILTSRMYWSWNRRNNLREYERWRWDSEINCNIRFNFH